MTMEIDINKYLTEQQMAEIAERIYKEKATAYIETMIREIERWGSGMFDRVSRAVVEQYAKKISPKYEERIMQEIEIEIKRTESSDEHYNDTFVESVRNVLHTYARELIEEHKEELQPIIYDKIIAACNNDLFSKIVSDIMYHLDINGVIKEVTAQIKGNLKGRQPTDEKPDLLCCSNNKPSKLYLCPQCENEEHDTDAKFCIICGLEIVGNEELSKSL